MMSGVPQTGSLRTLVALVAGGFAAWTAVAPMAAMATPPHGKLVQLASTAFVRTGRWERVEGRFDGRRDGASLRSHDPGARLKLEFEGRAVGLRGVLGKNGGLGVVMLDGYVVSVTTFYAPRKKTNVLVFLSPLLKRGKHRIEVEVVRSPRSQNLKPGYVNIEGADVVS
ncbi:MAG: hypothetical protein NVS2B3_10140 [Vulcanimicrobiaceae bacterium]